MSNRFVAMPEGGQAGQDTRSSDSRDAGKMPAGPLLLLCLYAFLFSAYYAIANPPFEAPDEPAHLAYVNYVAHQKELPDQSHPRRDVEGEGHQHPLYYVVAATVPAAYTPWDRVNHRVFPNTESVLGGGTRQDVPVHMGVHFERDEDREAFYLLRLLNSLFVSLTVWVTGLAARLILRPGSQLWPPFLVATLPQFQFSGGSISNDAFAALLAAVAVYHGIKALQLPVTRRWVAFGVWIGLAVLAKKSNLALVPLGLALPFLITRDGVALKRLGWVALAAGLFVIPLLNRNLALYGDLLGTRMERETLAGLVESKPATYFLKNFPLGIARSFFAEFGWMNVHVPLILPLLFYGILLGPLLYVRQQTRELGALKEGLFCGGAVVLVLAGVAFYNLTFTQPQGRLLFPALSALALLWGVGMERFSGWVRFVPLALIAMDVVCAMVNWSFYR